MGLVGAGGSWTGSCEKPRYAYWSTIYWLISWNSRAPIKKQESLVSDFVEPVIKFLVNFFHDHGWWRSSRRTGIKPTTYPRLGHVGFYKPGFMSTRHMGCHLFLGTQRDLYKCDITRGRFSTVIFSTTHRCNIVATLFWIVTTLFVLFNNTLRLRENGRNCSQHCWPSYKFDDFQTITPNNTLQFPTTRNNLQQHVIGWACKRTRDVTSNDTGSCWVGQRCCVQMKFQFHPFARGFRNCFPLFLTYHTRFTYLSERQN